MLYAWRMTRTRLIALSCILTASVLAAPACVIVADDDASLLVVNDSDYAIFELYVAPVGTRTWGPNLIGPQGLYPGEELLITNIDCDYYDLLLIDEDGVSCEVYDVDLCANDGTWIVRNNTCTVFEALSDKDSRSDKDAPPAPGI